jgi:hypothetical protein
MQKQFKGLRIAKSHKWEFDSDAKSVFLLLCPTKENDWIEGWEQIHELIYSESGIAEDACVFTTNGPEEGYAVWLTSKYSLENTHIEFVKHIVAQEVIIRWKMEVRPLASNKCTVFSIYNATGLSEKGNKFVQVFKESGFTNLMTGLEELISYYLLTGDMKKRA